MPSTRPPTQPPTCAEGGVFEELAERLDIALPPHVGQVGHHVGNDLVAAVQMKRGWAAVLKWTAALLMAQHGGLPRPRRLCRPSLASG